MLKLLIPLWVGSALASAALLSRDDHAGTGVLWGLACGPVGLLIVLRKRATWEHRWQRDQLRGEEARKEQAWREWRGYWRGNGAEVPLCLHEQVMLRNFPWRS